MPDEQESLPPFPGFETIEKMGEGGMCVVYRVRSIDDPTLERAIKVLTDTEPKSVTRFEDEAELLMRLNHPNILSVHHLEHADPPWIVMDLLAGDDLEEVRMRGPMDPEKAAEFFAMLANGLSRVHALGVRHRDIKPANIMLGHDGVPKLIDFGIAREISKAHMTATGFVVGTAAYLPPEIFTSDKAQDIQDTEQADVYALGQALCEMLTGELVIPPVDGHAAQVLARVMRTKLQEDNLDPRVLRPQVPDDLAEIVMAATEMEPEDRIPTAAEFEDRLRAWLRSRKAAYQAPVTAAFDPSSLVVPGESRPVPDKRTPAPSTRTISMAPVKQAAKVGTGLAASGALLGALAVGFVLLLGLGLGGLWYFRPGQGPSPVELDQARAVLKSNATKMARRCGRGRATFTMSNRQWQMTGSTGKAKVDRCLRTYAAKMEAPNDATVTIPLTLK